jgi:DNA polymerase-1
LRDLLHGLNLHVAIAPGYEADDVLGTLAQLGAERGYAVKILSGDRDLFQLVDDARQISVLYMDHRALKSKTGATEFKEADVEQKLGVKATQVVDFKALCGDKSDNIPGVAGIGEKTAAKLLADYQDLSGVYAHLDSISAALQKKLVRDREKAELSQFLAQIKQDIALDWSLERCQLQGFDPEQVRSQLERLELKNLIAQLDQLQRQLGSTAAENPSPQAASIMLFDDEDTWFFSAAETRTAQQAEAKAQAIQPQIIDTPEKLQTLIATLETCRDLRQPVAWDTETTALDPYQAELVGLGCCWGNEPEKIAYIPVGHYQGQQLDRATALAMLSPILSEEKYPKVLQNAKFDRLILRQQGVKLAGVVFDPMLASYVLQPTGSHNLTELSLRYLEDLASLSYSDLEIPKGQTIADLPIPKIANYCGLDAYTTFLLVEKLQAKLEENPRLNQLFNEIEIPLEPVLAEMEAIGVRIDRAYLQDLSTQLEAQLKSIEENAYQTAGQEFNLNSPKQLSQLLFETLGLNPKRSRKTKTGYSTDHATLEKLQGDHPIIDSILEHRTLAKLKSTYVDALPNLVNPKTDRLHTDFNQAVTATGRLSSSNPNLQNIPIRSEFSRQIRQAFIPREGWTLIAADYSQIELRILAHLSNEPILIEAYQNREDVHALTARLLFDKTEITPDERRLGKTINFGVIYGMGAQRFAREMGVSPSEGKEFISRYHQRYAHVFEYLESQKRCAIAQGYVETIRGRRRYFDFVGQSVQDLRGRDPSEIDLNDLKKLSAQDSQSLRAAANAPIQGSSADIIKLAMVKLGQLLPQYETKLLLQVHDELVFEAPPQELEVIIAIIQSTMEQAESLKVPLVVEVNQGANWMTAK